MLVAFSISATSALMRLANSCIDIVACSPPPCWRMETSPSAASFSPTITKYGMRLISLSRIFLPIVSFLKSVVARTPLSSRYLATSLAYSSNFPEIGYITTWSGVCDSGNRPAVCSMSTAVKRSIEPKGARCIITGVCFELSSALYSRLNRCGRL